MSRLSNTLAFQELTDRLKAAVDPAQASRNGYFFVLDRTNGKNLVTKEFVKTNWSQGVDSKGQPIPDPAKEPQIDGALVTPNQGGAANWPPPSFSPQTGLFYINAAIHAAGD